MNKALFAALAVGLLVALTACNREPTLQEQLQASQEKLQAQQREAIQMLKQKAAGGEKAKP